MPIKIMFGIQLASIAGQVAFMANVEDMEDSRIYVKLKNKPMPKDKPIPPFFFSQERDTPMKVKMKAAKADA